MISFIIYLLCFLLLFTIIKKEYKVVCFLSIIIISIQIVFSYYMNIGKIQDLLYYLIILFVLDLIVLCCIITNNILIKEYKIILSLLALFFIFSTILCIFDYSNFSYLQYSSLVIMECAYFNLKPEQNHSIAYYLISSLLIIPHML